MSQISTLITGAGIVTTVSGQAQTDMYLLLGDVDTAMPLQGIQVEVDGESKINIQGSQPLVSAFAKFMQQFSATLVGLVIKVATGIIPKNTTYRFTNNGATTPAIFAFSEAGSGSPLLASTKGINALSQETFKNFSALLITPSANMGTVDIEFEDGSRSTYTAVELDALFASKWATDANGRLDPVVTGISNVDQSIKSVKVNATTAVTVAVLKLPDEVFQTLKKSA